ncbi:hypothetical protein VNO80_10389 [Phaseolus coccineus]|uniref:Uncharacterized protein n=1 Tax=Phaseolus coccineus TaxID=3886 RepID=A0AAN9NDC7_PHACN
MSGTSPKSIWSMILIEEVSVSYCTHTRCRMGRFCGSEAQPKRVFQPDIHIRPCRNEKHEPYLALHRRLPSIFSLSIFHLLLIIVSNSSIESLIRLIPDIFFRLIPKLSPFSQSLSFSRLGFRLGFSRSHDRCISLCITQNSSFWFLLA